MHGSSCQGDCVKALQELDGVMKEVWGENKSVKNFKLYRFSGLNLLR
jgi:hypothetical protein